MNAAEQHEQGRSSIKEMNERAVSLYERGEYNLAIPILQQACDLCRHVLVPTDPTFTTVLNNLAGVYYELEMYAEAEPLAAESVEIRRRHLGENDPKFLASHRRHQSILK